MNTIMPNLVVHGGSDNWYTLTVNTTTNPIEFGVKFNHTHIQPLSFQDAANDAAFRIGAQYSNIYLGLSGGLDSEFVAEVLLRNRIPFTPVICVIPGSSEYHYAQYWCYKNKISPIVIDLESKLPDLAKTAAWMLNRIPTRKIMWATINAYIIQVVEELGGVVIVGDPDLTYKTVVGRVFDFNTPIGDTFDNNVSGHIAELFFAKKHPGAFFWYTPELAVAAIQEINTDVNFDIARAELYRIPYRPKCQQLMDDVISLKSLGLLETIFKFKSVTDAIWTKDELISQLNLNSGLRASSRYTNSAAYAKINIGE